VDVTETSGLSSKAQHTHKHEDESHGSQSKRCEILRHDRHAGFGMCCMTRALKAEKQQRKTRQTFNLRPWGVLVNCVCPVFKLSCVQRYQRPLQVRAI